jgi:large subunit ribosomal protein L6
MSRIGRLPVKVPPGVKVAVSGRTITIEGPKGKLTQEVAPEIGISAEGGEITLSRAGDERRTRQLHGLARSLVQNMVTGVSQGFARSLVINGVGYRAEVQGRNLVLTLGYSNPIEYPIRDGIKIEVEANTRIRVTGADRELVGQVGAEIRKFRPPEPYKGKGIKYEDEVLIRKVGKTGVG